MEEQSPHRMEEYKGYLHVLWQLGRLAAARLARDNHDLIVIVVVEFEELFPLGRDRETTTQLEELEVSSRARLPIPRIGGAVLDGLALLDRGGPGPAVFLHGGKRLGALDGSRVGGVGGRHLDGRVGTFGLNGR